MEDQDDADGPKTIYVADSAESYHLRAVEEGQDGKGREAHARQFHHPPANFHDQRCRDH